ncbi:MAG: hypothetical protein K6A36_07215, partial [Paludibacteraceae bacterium]|nr:hypothetical protein [Paludibacteraceae bacterium]
MITFFSIHYVGQFLSIKRKKKRTEMRFCAFGTFGRGLPPCGIKVLEAVWVGITLPAIPPFRSQKSIGFSMLT